MEEKRNDPGAGSESRLRTPVFPGSAALRRALRSNIVSFPSRISTILKQPEANIQWRVVLLFFVRGWSSSAIAARFDVPKHRILKSLNEWSSRALALGYIQIIDPEAFAACCQVDVEYGINRENDDRPADSRAMSADLGNALDGAIAHCAESRGEFWKCLTTLLGDMRETAAVAFEARQPARGPVGKTEGIFATLPNGGGGIQHSSRVREEERVYHA